MTLSIMLVALVVPLKLIVPAAVPSFASPHWRCEQRQPRQLRQELRQKLFFS